MLEGDTNGDGVADFGIELTGNLTLTHGRLHGGQPAADVLTGSNAHGGANDTLTGQSADDARVRFGDTLSGWRRWRRHHDRRARATTPMWWTMPATW